MDVARKELLIARICSGTVRIHIELAGKKTALLLKRPTRQQLYVAHEIYLEQLQEAREQELFDQDQLLNWMLACGHWTDEQEKLVKTLPTEIEEFKVSLFKAAFKVEEKKKIRMYLSRAREELAKLLTIRHSHDNISCEGVAALARSRFLVACSLYWPNDTPLFNAEHILDDGSPLLEKAMLKWADLRIDETAYRELARSEPWRSIWAVRKSDGSVFGCPVVDLTEEQRGLLGWSQLYDSIYEHPERPLEEVVNDDDTLDGWLIVQRRDGEKKLMKASAEELVTNEKIRNAGEVFIPADSVEGAKLVEALNDEGAAQIKRQRMAYLKQKGEVDETEMPDSKRKIRTQAAEAFSNWVKGGK